ncbi:MAG: hypothetical protein JXR48_06060 [Candidatus Delongbacteria bacterium]|nr:hypothetical protein [Candidatus Delongbacteria bacterium]MBN2834515.1 hypothetical protein [Candidatus Delongbacteria bacterium]
MKFLLLILTLTTMLYFNSCIFTTESDSDKEKFDTTSEIKFENEFFYKMIKRIDNSIVLFGSGNEHLIMKKIDSSGNLIWQKEYEENIGYHYLTNFEITNDGGFLVSGYFSHNNSGGTPFIAVFDNEGLMKWIKKDDDLILDNTDSFKAVEDSNGDIVTVTQSGMARWDSEGNLIWLHWFYQGYFYEYNSVVYYILNLYDFTVNDGICYILYDSPYSDFVAAYYDIDGNLEHGYFFNNEIPNNLQIINTAGFGYASYPQFRILGNTENIDGEIDFFMMEALTYTNNAFPKSETYSSKETFDCYIGDIFKDGEELIITSSYDSKVVCLDYNTFELKWKYNDDSKASGDFSSTVRIEDENYLVLIPNDTWNENSEEVRGTTLRFFKRN